VFSFGDGSRVVSTQAQPVRGGGPSRDTGSRGGPKIRSAGPSLKCRRRSAPPSRHLRAPYVNLKGAAPSGSAQCHRATAPRPPGRTPLRRRATLPLGPRALAKLLSSAAPGGLAQRYSRRTHTPPRQRLVTINAISWRGSSAVEQRIHKPQVEGPIPSPATTACRRAAGAAVLAVKLAPAHLPSVVPVRTDWFQGPPGRGCARTYESDGSSSRQRRTCQSP
jgi:hypothetical protein